MDVEKIIIVDEEEEFPAIARLIELGRQKSYVTLDDILHFFPEAEQDVEQLEEAFSALLSAGIPFVEDTTPGEPTEDELAACTAINGSRGSNASSAHRKRTNGARGTGEGQCRYPASH